VTIADDGVGLDASRLNGRTAGSGFGLLSVREHLTLLGGSCRIQSTPSRGTQIEISVPLKAEAAK
jgi:signal transduction histidine kinase